MVGLELGGQGGRTVPSTCDTPTLCTTVITTDWVLTARRVSYLVQTSIQCCLCYNFMKTVFTSECCLRMEVEVELE